jgi:hypothetical protein
MQNTGNMEHPMNAALSEKGRVHRLIDGLARCGTGKNRKRGPWQMELGEVTCLRCRKLETVLASRTGHLEKDCRSEGTETITAGEAIGHLKRDLLDSRLGLIGLSQHKPVLPFNKG